MGGHARSGPRLALSVHKPDTGFSTILAHCYGNDAAMKRLHPSLGGCRSQPIVFLTLVADLLLLPRMNPMFKALRFLVPALGVLMLAGLAAPAPVRANEICAAEVQPLMQRHQSVMQATQAAMPRGLATTIDQARANATRACQALGNAQASFERLRAWMSNNADFCRIPDQMVAQVNTGLANVTRNRRQACAAVATIERQRRQLQAGGGPLGPQRPQRLDLRTPGAL